MRKHAGHTKGCVNCQGTFVHACQTQKFQVTISEHAGASTPFWTKYTSTKEEAERIFAKNQLLIKREQWRHVIQLAEVVVPCEWAARIVEHDAVISNERSVVETYCLEN